MLGPCAAARRGTVVIAQSAQSDQSDQEQPSDTMDTDPGRRKFVSGAVAITAMGAAAAIND